MKRIFSLTLALLMVFGLCACQSDYKKADEFAVEFIKALLDRDEEKMKEYLHPDYAESALPDDEFYKELEENAYFSVGNSLDGLDSTMKTYLEDESLDGTALECCYVARSNEVFYNFEIIILENDNGYGIVSVAAALNRDPNYYKMGQNQ